MIKKFAIFFVFVVFCDQAFGQTNRPLSTIRTGVHEICGDYSQEMYALPVRYYPWGVCLGKKSELSWTQDDWTREAMRIWNVEYKNYKINRWGSDHVVGIPEGSLFVESCNRNKYNIIYLEKYDLPKRVLGRFRPIHTFWDFLTFYSIIIVDTKKPDGGKRLWNRYHFINVMLHELGHALGIPHINTEIMQSNGFGCNNYHTSNICDIHFRDFEKFLWPYDPEDAYVYKPSPSQRSSSSNFRCVQNRTGMPRICL